VIDGYAYLHRRDKYVSCVEIKTGTEKWKSPEAYGEYWSMVANGKQILALDQRGILYLLQADPQKMQVIDQRRISDAETWAHVAVCGNEVFIRELNAVAAYRWQ
jgi:outer membrane protein assembly factor BamB